MLKKISKKLDEVLSKNFGIAFIILSILIVVILSLLATICFSIYSRRFSEPLISPDGYAALFGALGGGAMTLFGVLLTMKEQDKQRKFDLQDKERQELEIINQTKPIYEMSLCQSSIVGDVYQANGQCIKYLQSIPANFDRNSLIIKAEDIRHKNMSETQTAFIKFYEDIIYKYESKKDEHAFKKEDLAIEFYDSYRCENGVVLNLYSFDMSKIPELEKIIYFPELFYKNFRGNYFKRRFIVEIDNRNVEIKAEETKLITEIEFVRETSTNKVQ